jgi:hypothetical protein
MISAIAGIAAAGDARYRTMVHRWGCHSDHAAVVLAWLIDHARDLQEAPHHLMTWLRDVGLPDNPADLTHGRQNSASQSDGTSRASG